MRELTALLSLACGLWGSAGLLGSTMLLGFDGDQMNRHVLGQGGVFFW
jgi:hypothetical protein